MLKYWLILVQYYCISSGLGSGQILVHVQYWLFDYVTTYQFSNVDSAYACGLHNVGSVYVGSF